MFSLLEYNHNLQKFELNINHFEHAILENFTEDKITVPFLFLSHRNKRRKHRDSYGYGNGDILVITF